MTRELVEGAGREGSHQCFREEITAVLISRWVQEEIIHDSRLCKDEYRMSCVLLIEYMYN